MIKNITDGKLVFVFGSNLAGVHGAGAAKFACEKMGAKMGKGVGLHGNSYALPVKGADIKTLPLHEVKVHVNGFLDYAKRDPGIKYKLTRVGCGLAGFQDAQMAELFRDSPSNVVLPGAWRSILDPRLKIIAPICSHEVGAQSFFQEIGGILERKANLGSTVVLSAQAGTPEAHHLTMLEREHPDLMIQIISPNMTLFQKASEAQRSCEETLLWLSSDCVLFGEESDMRLKRISIAAKDRGIRVSRLVLKAPEQLGLLDNVREEGSSQYYTGVGSREAPREVLQEMRAIASQMSKKGYILRSGAALGADSAFEAGCDEALGSKEIWLPWKGFNDSPDCGLYPTRQMTEIASVVHPAWNALGQGPRKLHARNVGQVLGADCQTPSVFVVCWTPDGCETASNRSKMTGGTGTAIAVADHHDVPVFNLKNPESKVRLHALIDSLPIIEQDIKSPTTKTITEPAKKPSINDQAHKLAQKKRHTPSF